MNNWTDYSAFEWVMIDVASRYGMDKEHFDVRIQWVVDTILPMAKMSEDFTMFKALMKPFIEAADEQPMFCGALIALWDAINDVESTWQVGQDAASSGPQLLSVLLKDIIGMRNTGVLGTEMPDLYTTCTDEMNRIGKGTTFKRKVVKKGIVPHVYASKREPMRVFGKNYPTFLKAYRATVPMAQEASDIMVKGWNENATEHMWVMPDGAVVRVPVLVQRKKTLPCGKHSFEYVYDELGTKKAGESGTKSLSANTTHSYDAYMLRELNRRCNYNVGLLRYVDQILFNALVGHSYEFEKDADDHIYYLEQLFFKFNQASAVAFEYLTPENAQYLSVEFLQALAEISHHMSTYVPFEITNIHDEFKCLPHAVGDMKTTYNRLLVETYYSDWWIQTAKDLTGNDYSLMLSTPDADIAAEIMNAPYSIG